MTKLDRTELRVSSAYNRGVNAYAEGYADVNPYGTADILEMCAWSAGYFDRKRGLA